MKTKKATFLIFILFVYSCATFEPQYKDSKTLNAPKNKEISHEFYLIGDAGYANVGTGTPTLDAFKKILSEASTDMFIKL